jgi:hypothetical protein
VILNFSTHSTRSIFEFATNIKVTESPIQMIKNNGCGKRIEKGLTCPNCGGTGDDPDIMIGVMCAGDGK